MLLDRLFAATYDRVMAPSERAGLREIRREVLAGVDGTVLEIGAGTGLNLQAYPSTVDTLILAEPIPQVADRLAGQAAARATDMHVQLEPWTAEAVGLPDSSVDHVVSTLVLCTVGDLERSVRELARVLRPGGSLHLVEHIGPADGLLGTTQRAIEPAWKVVARGCHLTRDPREALQGAGFDVSQINETTIPAPKLLRRALVGTATLG